jgi:hypothetical protein
MAPKNLRKRLEAMGIEVSLLRTGTQGPKGVMGTAPTPWVPKGTGGPIPLKGTGTLGPAGPTGELSRANTFSRPSGSPNLALVTNTSAAVVAEAAGIDSVRPRRLAQPRHAPEVLEIVAQGRRELAAECGLDLTDADVFELHVKETFAAWLEEKKAAIRAARSNGGGL